MHLIPPAKRVDERTIQGIEGRGDTGALLRLLGEDEVRESAKLRKRILIGLKKLHDRAATQTMFHVVEQDYDQGVRLTAMAVLRAVGDPASVPFLVKALKQSDDDGIRIHAIAALANASRGGAVEPLIAALDDRSATVRIAASEALARIGDPAAIPGMEAAKRTARNPFVSFALKIDLEKLRPRQE